jgi:hypothetical protein
LKKDKKFALATRGSSIVENEEITHAEIWGVFYVVDFGIKFVFKSSMLWLGQCRMEWRMGTRQRAYLCMAFALVLFICTQNLRSVSSFLPFRVMGNEARTVK